MNCLFDTHAHLDDSRFDGDRDAVIQNLAGCGVTNVVNVGFDVKSSKSSIRLAEKYDFIYAAVGYHPHDTRLMTDADLAEIERLAGHKKVLAIGEIGLDYHYDNSDHNTQKYWFKKQLKLAERLKMPVIIHNRDSHEDMMSLLKQTTARGILHCYSGSAEMAKEILKMGFYISFAGPVTYPNARNAVETAKIVPLDRILIETDCPYLAPQSHRGKRNDSSLVGEACTKLAGIKGISPQEMAEITHNNAKAVFRI